MTLKISKNSLLLWLYVAGALLLIVAAGFWCFKFSSDPERVFWGTFNRGLTSNGVTISAEQNNNGTTAKQNIQYSFGVRNVSRSVTTLTQGTTTVVNEVLATPTLDYTRYLDIKTDQKSANGKDFDLSKVIGVWAKGEEGTGRFFSQAVFGTSLPLGGMGIPVGKLSSDERAKLTKQAQSDVVYSVNFKEVKKRRVNGRLIYTYDVSIQPAAYVAMIKQYAKDLGLHDLDQLDPSSYKGQKPFTVQVYIDVHARQVTAIGTPDGNSKQTYLSYDMPVQVELPKQAITGKELQERLSSLK